MASKSAKPDNGNNNIVVDGYANLDGESNANGEQPIDPAQLGSADGYGDEYERDGDGNLVYGKSGQPRRKRGRRSGGSGAGSARKSSQAGTRNNSTIKQGLETLSQTLMIVHMGLAQFTNFEDFALKKEEADALSASMANVMEQFDWAPDPRFTAVSGLVTTSAMIYGPRLYLYREEMKKRARNKKEEAGSWPIQTALNGDASEYQFNAN